MIAELGYQLHPERIEAISSKIEAVSDRNDIESIKSSFGSTIDRTSIDRFLNVWRNDGRMKPQELAMALRGASASSVFGSKRGAIELVWTGPSTEMVPIRNTQRVLCEVIESAREKLFIVSFVAYKVESIIHCLNEAAKRQIRIDILLELSKEHGGKVSYDSVKAMQGSVPSANVYVWEKDESGIGAMHAKCAVADGKTAFITSANLSEAAMENNMELGVLIRAGHLPDELHRHLEALAITEKIKRV